MTREDFEILEDLELDEIAESIDTLEGKLAQWQAVGNAIMEAVMGHAGPLSDSDVIGAYRAVVAERDEARAARDDFDALAQEYRRERDEARAEVERLTAIQNGLITGQSNALMEIERLRAEAAANAEALAIGQAVQRMEEWMSNTAYSDYTIRRHATHFHVTLWVDDDCIACEPGDTLPAAVDAAMKEER